jgi:cell shape-determining protein MreD
MWRHYLLSAIIILVLILLQGNSNLILLFLMASIIFYSFNYTIFWAVIAGYLLDLYSNYSFGLHLVCFLSIIIIIFFLTRNFINSRTWWAILSLFYGGIIFYNILFSGLSYILYKMNFNYYFFHLSLSDIIFQLVVCALFLVLGFYFKSFFKRYLLIYGMEKK